MFFVRAINPVLNSGKKEKNCIGPTTLNFPVRGGKLGIYNLHNPHDILFRFRLIAPSGGKKECPVVCVV